MKNKEEKSGILEMLLGIMMIVLVSIEVGIELVNKPMEYDVVIIEGLFILIITIILLFLFKRRKIE